MRSTNHWGMAVLLVLGGCTVDAGGDVEDGASDTFAVDGAADSFGAHDGTPEACAVLELANLATEHELDVELGLTSRAAAAIARHRAGLDTIGGTADDDWISDLAELDAIRWIGPATYRRMRNYAPDAGYACGEVQVQVLAFNDFHGNLETPTGSAGRIQTGPNAAVDRVDAGGAEFLATHLVRLAAANPNTVIVSAGDVIGATPLLSALFHDEPTIESMNLMGLDVAGVGNHEFDEGPGELMRMQFGGCHPVDGCADGDPFEGADFEYLAANVIDDESGETLLPSWTVRNFGSARVAFIGLTLEGTPSVTTAAGVEGLSFLDEAETINALVPEIQAEGVHSIVVLIHEGGAATGLYSECVGISGPLFDITSHLDAEIDVVVAGHTNAAHVCDMDGLLVTSAAHAGRLITDIDLVVDELTGEIVSRHGANVIVTRDVPRDAAQTALIEKYRALAAPMANRVIGAIAGDLVRAAAPSGESTLGDVLADAQLDGTSATAGAVIAFMNPGGIRTDLLRATISAGEQPGEITYAEAFAVQPFGNNLVTMSLTGAQIEQLLEQQWAMQGTTERQMILQVSHGFSYAWDPTRAVGDRVDAATLTLDGVSIDPAATYRVTMNSFLADGGDGFTVFRAGTDRVAGPVDLDPLAAYLTAHAPLAAPTLGRIVRR